MRGGDDEAPYLRAFVAHYAALGFDKIYYINTAGPPDYVHRSISPDLQRCVTVLDIPRTGYDWQERVLNEALPLVAEDWILSVDVDEFLSLSLPTIGDYLRSLPETVSKVHLPWILCLSTQFVQDSMRAIARGSVFRSRLFKTIARTRQVTACGIHDLETTSGVAVSSRHLAEASILHFACRGLYDLIGRIVGRDYQNAKSGAEEERRLVRFFQNATAKAQHYPFRFNMYRVQLSSPPTTLDLRAGDQALEMPTNKQLVRAIFLAKMADLGIRLPNDVDDSLDLYIEDRFRVRGRILENLPSSKYAEMHLSSGMSYVNATRAYVAALS